MHYVLTIDLKTAGVLDRKAQEILRVAISSIIEDNLESAQVEDIRFGMCHQISEMKVTTPDKTVTDLNKTIYTPA